MTKLLVVVVFATLSSCVFSANERDSWVWSKRGDDEHPPRPFLDEASARYQGSTINRNVRTREPTTGRPLPGQPQNDEIDDYPDDEVNTNVGTRNYPYPPFDNSHLFGTNNYPGFGGSGSPVGGGNGILVGPGGPTGVIGRPQSQYPGFPSNGFIGQPGAGFPAFGGGGYLGPTAGINPGFGGQFGGAGQFGSGQYPAGGQYPIAGQFGANGPYPGAFAAGGTQYPGNEVQGSQFPSAQYPGAGPQYTEGYGFASPSGRYPGYVQYPGGNLFGYGTTFNDNSNVNRKLQVEGKSAVVAKSNNLTDQVDDRINKGFPKVPK